MPGLNVPTARRMAQPPHDLFRFRHMKARQFCIHALNAKLPLQSVGKMLNNVAVVVQNKNVAVGWHKVDRLGHDPSGMRHGDLAVVGEKAQYDGLELGCIVFHCCWWWWWS